jgi:SRSO17 transposase
VKSAHWFVQGKADPAFRTKPQIAVELIARAVAERSPCRAVVADAFYGENETFHIGLHRLQVGFVVALKRSHAWWRPKDEVGSLLEAAVVARWMDQSSQERGNGWCGDFEMATRKTGGP